MKLDETVLRRTISKNIASQRKAHHDTQLDLARKLNYSDKSVSKWERGESLPDVFVLAQIAELYGVTVSNLIGEVQIPKKAKPYYHLFIYLLSVAIVFALATVLFTSFLIADVPFAAWLFYIYAVPAAAIVSVVFSSLWWGIWQQTASITVLIWSLPLCAVLTFPQITILSQLFIDCAAAQVLCLLWETFRYFHKRK